MSKRILVAGATGAVGKRLLPLLVAEGYSVSGTTRSPDKTKIIEGAGAHAIVVDVFDSAALARAVRDARPQIIIHQLTDLPPGLDPARMADAVPRNARIRSEGTRNLVTAALAAGASRLISQSIAWRSQGISAEGVQMLEHLTLESPPLEGIVLRYGHLYGPGTGRPQPSGELPCHVDVAAAAALIAIDKGEPGIFSVVDWDPYLRVPSGTK